MTPAIVNNAFQYVCQNSLISRLLFFSLLIAGGFGCAIEENGIFGPYVFEDNDVQAVTVNPKRYIDMLRGRFIPAITVEQCSWHEYCTVVFHQNGAPQCSNRTPRTRNSYFSENIGEARSGPGPPPIKI